MQSQIKLVSQPRKFACTLQLNYSSTITPRNWGKEITDNHAEKGRGTPFLGPEPFCKVINTATLCENTKKRSRTEKNVLLGESQSQNSSGNLQSEEIYKTSKNRIRIKRNCLRSLQTEWTAE